MALTTFSNVQLAEQQANLENVWAQPQKQKNYTPRVDALKAILEQQTAQLELLEDPNKEYDVRLKWIDHATSAPAAMTQNDDCANTAGTEGVGKTQSYALDYKKSLAFSVEKDQFEKAFSTMDEAIATGQAQVIKTLLEDFNATIPGIINTGRGTPAAAFGTGMTGWTVDAAAPKQITIAAANYSAETIIPQLMKVKRLARFSDALIMDGGSLFNEYYKGLKSVVNGEGKLINELYGDIPYRHDMDAFPAASLTDSFFVIDPGTLAVANRAKYPSINNAEWTHGASGSYLRYSIPVSIASLPQLIYVNQGALAKQSLTLDVQYSIICTGGKEFLTWRFMLRAGVFVTPVRNLTTNTGILKFTRV
jgi:hypothetical protein